MTDTSHAGKEQSCPYCGNIHLSRGVCPIVRAFEYYPDGTIKRVEFKTAADYDNLGGLSLPPAIRVKT